MKTKTRSVTSNVDWSWWVTDLDDYVVNPGDSGNNSYIGKYESIQYVNQRAAYNPCIHHKFNCELESVERKYRKASTAEDRWDHVTTVWPGTNDTPTYILDLAKETAGLSSFDWQDFYQRAIEAMTPTMESGFSLGNFMYEIREIKSLVKWWDKGKSFVKNLGDAYLNYSFGLRPFMMDVERLVFGLFSVADRLKALKAGSGKLCTRRYSEEEGDLDYENQWWPNQDNGLKHKLVIPNVKYTAVMHYTYQYPDIDEDLEKLYALLDTFGLNLNPQIVWDAIPYTFVVDWIFNVGDFLSQLRKKWIPCTITIKEFGVSVKMHYYLDRWVVSYGTGGGDWHWCGQAWGKFYARRPVKVDDRCFKLSMTGNLTTRQYILGSLLLKQRAVI